MKEITKISLRNHAMIDQGKQDITVSKSRSNGVLCVACEGTKNVCEGHPYLPWGGVSDSKGACKCGRAGILCPECG